MFGNLDKLRVMGAKGKKSYLAARVTELPEVQEYTIDLWELREPAPALTDSMSMILNAVATLSPTGHGSCWKPIRMNQISQYIRKDPMAKVLKGWDRNIEIAMQSLMEDKVIRVVKYQRHLYLVPTRELVLKLAKRHT